jgi:integrase
MIEARQDGWRNEKHASQWRSTLSSHAYPTLGQRPVSEIDTDDVLAVLNPIWNKIPETARRLRGRIETVLDFARARGWRRGENPARWRGHLAELLPAPRKTASRQPSLDWREVSAFFAALRVRDGMAALALQFTILTGARTGETRGMTWNEVDLDARIWTIPARRMKAGNTHRVPLSTPAIELLHRMRGLVGANREANQRLVFPGARIGRPLSDMALSMLVRGMATDGLPADARPRWRDTEGRAVVPHGFRATFRGWTRAHSWPDYLGELALAHVDPNKVRAAYAREDLLDERRPMMESWAKYCSNIE